MASFSSLVVPMAIGMDDSEKGGRITTNSNGQFILRACEEMNSPRRSGPIPSGRSPET